jgi:hypothetical protein
MQVGRRIEVPIALGAHVLVRNVGPVSNTVVVPMRSTAIIAPTTYNSTAVLTAVIE